MEILYYSIAIVIVAVAIVLFFIFRAKKHNRELEKFKNEIKTSVDINMENMSLASSQEKTTEEQEVLENFSLEEEKQDSKNDSNVKPIRKPILPEIEDDNDSEFDDEFERRFAEFKKYMSMDEDEQDLPDENDEDEEDNENFFDVDNLKNKTKEEVLEEIKNLPPEAQEIILKHYEEIKNQEN